MIYGNKSIVGTSGRLRQKGGWSSLANGGDFLSGMTSGAFGSLAATGTGALLKGANGFWNATGTIASGSLVGGVGAEISGGNFWDGVRNGAISSGLNHVAHMMMERRDYEYKGKKYTDKGELYKDILMDQAAEQFGITDILALAAALDNQGLLSKPFQIEGASKGTSLASEYGSKLIPREMPKRLPTHIRNGTVRYTKVLGRFLGRMAGPIGWGILAYDVGMTLYKTQTIYNSVVNGKR